MPLRSSGLQDSDDVPSPISEGSIGIARLVRTQSRATFLAIVIIHASSEPRSGSNITPLLHARSNATCTTSSAVPKSPTIRNAIKDSRREKCCTNSPAHSGLPAQKPSRRSLSDSLFCLINTPPSSRHSRLPSMRTTWRPPRSHSASESETQPTPVQVASSPSKVVAYCCATEREVHLLPRREDPPKNTTTSLLLVRRIE